MFKLVCHLRFCREESEESLCLCSTRPKHFGVMLGPKLGRGEPLCGGGQSMLLESAGDRVGDRPLAEPGDVKTHFVTREGTYRLMTLSEYSRPNRVGYQPQGQTPPQVRVSLVSLPDQVIKIFVALFFYYGFILKGRRKDLLQSRKGIVCLCIQRY